LPARWRQNAADCAADRGGIATFPSHTVEHAAGVATAISALGIDVSVGRAISKTSRVLPLPRNGVARCIYT